MVILGAAEGFSEGLHRLGGRSTKPKDKSTSKRWQASGRALALFHRMRREARYLKTRDAVTTSIVPTSDAIILFNDHCAARNLQQDNVHLHYINEAVLGVEATVPPGFSPVQEATELGSSASNVCV